MNGGRRIIGRVSLAFLTGLGLLGIAFFAPDVAHHNGYFFKIAMASPWQNVFDLAAAWCSLKIILLGVGLFLIIESLGSMLVRLKHEYLAWAVFSLHFASCTWILFGGFCLVKALL